LGLIGEKFCRDRTGIAVFEAANEVFEWRDGFVSWVCFDAEPVVEIGRAGSPGW
jgi:hypothetical protein